MFYGPMAETKNSIDLPDYEYESLLELLRFLYYEEVIFNWVSKVIRNCFVFT